MKYKARNRHLEDCETVALVDSVVDP